MSINLPLLSIMQHWQRLDPRGPEKLSGRYWHAAAVLCSPLLGQSETQILVVGGYGHTSCWLMDLDEVAWKQVSVVSRQ